MICLYLSTLLKTCEAHNASMILGITIYYLALKSMFAGPPPPHMLRCTPPLPLK